MSATTTITTITADAALVRSDAAGAPYGVEALHPASAPSSRRAAWPLWGALAGAAGVTATLLTISPGSVPDEDLPITAENYLQYVSRARYHVGVVAGFVAVLALLVAAAGWRRWLAERAPGSLAGRVLPAALTASAGAMMLGFGMKGSLAVYLPGGMDEGMFAAKDLFAVHLFLDFAPFVAWWGVSVAAGATAWLAFRERMLPRWMGVLGGIALLLPVALMAATGLPGFPGVIGGGWMVVVSTALAARGGAAPRLP